MARNVNRLRDVLRADDSRRVGIDEYTLAMLDALDVGAVRECATTPSEMVSSAPKSSTTSLALPGLQDDLYFAALREDVEVLGGQLELRAVFPDEVIDLLPQDHSPVEDVAPSTE